LFAGVWEDLQQLLRGDGHGFLQAKINPLYGGCFSCNKLYSRMAATSGLASKNAFNFSSGFVTITGGGLMNAK
jgi:hypothetical protein